MLSPSYRGCLRFLFCRRRVWVELQSSSSGLFALIHHHPFSILWCDIVVGILRRLDRALRLEFAFEGRQHFESSGSGRLHRVALSRYNINGIERCERTKTVQAGTAFEQVCSDRQEGWATWLWSNNLEV